MNAKIAGYALIFCLAASFGGLVWPAGTLAGARQDDADAARQGLATIDSLLQVPAIEPAVTSARELWTRWGDHPIYGWQIESRLGLALLLADAPGEAVPHLENTARQRPMVASHHRNLGAALLQLNRRGRALSEYQVAVELEPLDADMRREFGQLLLAFRDTRQAAEQLQIARELCDGCPEVDPPLASLYLMTKDFTRAVEPLRRIHDREPGSETRRALVVAMSQAGDDSALVAYLATIPDKKRTGDEWRLLIEAEGRQGGQAHSLLATSWLAAEGGQPAPVENLKDARFWGQVSLNLLASGDFESGLVAADHAIGLAPGEVVYLNNKVVLLTRLGRDAEARAEWQKVIALDPSLAQDSP